MKFDGNKVDDRNRRRDQNENNPQRVTAGRDELVPAELHAEENDRKTQDVFDVEIDSGRRPRQIEKISDQESKNNGKDYIVNGTAVFPAERGKNGPENRQ